MWRPDWILDTLMRSPTFGFTWIRDPTISVSFQKSGSGSLDGMGFLRNIRIHEIPVLQVQKLRDTDLQRLSLYLYSFFIWPPVLPLFLTDML